jgi:hypothetical protein
MHFLETMIWFLFVALLFLRTALSDSNPLSPIQYNALMTFYTQIGSNQTFSVVWPDTCSCSFLRLAQVATTPLFVLASK